MNCCGNNGLETFFSGRMIASEKRAYERRGLAGRQQQLLEALGDCEGARVLDIGGGIGVLCLELLKRGAQHAQLVEASPDSLQAAKELAAKQGVVEQITLTQGDFVRLEQTISADIVILDRVVCCYPNAEMLLQKAAGSSHKTLVFSYPQPFWFVRLLRQGINLFMKLRRRDYRFYLHEPSLLRQAALHAGHRPVMERSLGVWRLLVLER